jgi:hypothetical protein
MCCEHTTLTSLDKVNGLGEGGGRALAKTLRPTPPSRRSNFEGIT